MGRSFNFPKFRAGEPLLPQLTAERLNALVDAIDRNRVEFGDNVTGQRTPGGTIVRAHSRGSDDTGDLDIAFFLTDLTGTEGDPPETTNKVGIFDGKINGEFPTGMGTGGYSINIPAPADSIVYAGITFDPETLAITSRFLGASSSSEFPESRVDEEGGFAYWQLGFTYFDGDGDWRIVMTRLGDINFAITAGAFNGLPALLVDGSVGWLDLDVLFP